MNDRLEQPQVRKFRDGGRRRANASKLGKMTEIDAFAETQTHQKHFVGLLGGCQFRHLDDAVSRLLDPSRPGFRIAFGDGRATLTIDEDAAVRSWADTRIFAVAPIEKVVPALRTGTRVIRHLIGGKAARRGHLFRDLVKRTRVILVRNDELARSVKRRVRRVRLYRELVKRQVIAREIESFRKLGAPVVRRLTGTRINEVERKSLERSARNLKSGLRFRNAMNTPELAKLIVPQRLHAD